MPRSPPARRSEIVSGREEGRSTVHRRQRSQAVLRTDVRAVGAPEGTRWEVSRDVDANPEAVWDLLTDPDRWPEWGPAVGAVRCDDDRIRRGTRGELRVAGTWHPFTVETVDETDLGVRRWTWRIRDVAATGHRVGRRADGGAHVVFEVPLWAMAAVSVCVVAARQVERLALRETTKR